MELTLLYYEWSYFVVIIIPYHHPRARGARMALHKMQNVAVYLFNCCRYMILLCSEGMARGAYAKSTHIYIQYFIRQFYIIFLRLSVVGHAVYWICLCIFNWLRISIDWTFFFLSFFFFTTDGPLGSYYTNSLMEHNIIRRHWSTAILRSV